MWKFILLGLCFALSAEAHEETAIRLPSGVEVLSDRFAAAPDAPLLLWFANEHGIVAAERRAAADLSVRGADVWLTDWLAPYFLPQLPGSLARVPDADLGDWLAAIRKQHPQRPVWLLAAGRAADLALRAAAELQKRRDTPPAGAVLLFPLLYRGVEAGAEPDYAPVVDATRLDLALLVPKASAGYWWRDRLKSRLEAAGSRVRLDTLAGLRDGFYRRGDASETEVAAGSNLAGMIWQAIEKLHTAVQP